MLLSHLSHSLRTRCSSASGPTHAIDGFVRNRHHGTLSHDVCSRRRYVTKVVPRVAWQICDSTRCNGLATLRASALVALMTAGPVPIAACPTPPAMHDRAA